MADKFGRNYSSLEAPATDGFVVSANDDVEFSQATRSVYVGEGGNLCVEMISNTVLTFIGVPAGTELKIRVNRVYANTTANSIVGLF